MCSWFAQACICASKFSCSFSQSSQEKTQPMIWVSILLVKVDWSHKKSDWSCCSHARYEGLTDPDLVMKNIDLLSQVQFVASKAENYLNWVSL